MERRELILPFGKYKGKSIYDINDKPYLRWLITVADRNLRAQIEAYLDKGFIPIKCNLADSIEKPKKEKKETIQIKDLSNQQLEAWFEGGVLI